MLLSFKILSDKASECLFFHYFLIIYLAICCLGFVGGTKAWQIIARLSSYKVVYKWNQKGSSAMNVLNMPLHTVQFTAEWDEWETTNVFWTTYRENFFALLYGMRVTLVSKSCSNLCNYFFIEAWVLRRICPILSNDPLATLQGFQTCKIIVLLVTPLI